MDTAECLVNSNGLAIASLRGTEKRVRRRLLEVQAWEKGGNLPKVAASMEMELQLNQTALLSYQGEEDGMMQWRLVRALMSSAQPPLTKTPARDEGPSSQSTKNDSSGKVMSESTRG